MNQYVGIYRRCELSFIRAQLKPNQLQPLEGKVLMRLKGRCFTQEELVEYFEMDKGRMARELSALEERGLIRRVINENNRRQKQVTLTTEGEDMVSKLEAVFCQWEEICYQGFSDEEQKKYQEFIKRITENVVSYRHQKGESTYGK